MVSCTCPKYVDPQEVWVYSHKYVSAREKVCVGRREGVETVLIFKSLEGKQKLFIYIITKVSV